MNGDLEDSSFSGGFSGHKRSRGGKAGGSLGSICPLVCYRDVKMHKVILGLEKAQVNCYVEHTQASLKFVGS